MAKKTAVESEEVRLKEKVLAKRAGLSNPERDTALRALQKRLKREQRKRRVLAVRKKNAAGSKGEEAAPVSA